ncbi:DHH family phosphoesterase [Robertkochia solimangrovi]|uniref:DHH family phosphoesterase n=1 Tax=Robertkochia solimangrovi TaxID=2213046 RepID=UPI00117F4E81|nr:bifunctional oligoribonuclease/PAP phosphatase NrnA [Robertkochia solimangrovi]TRZ43597.1 bifunctional oligoribonuclease/PAP phosphatase NrnA [Robertkochia solimangrovi]
MTEQKTAALKSLLTDPKNIVIIPHKNPDGDAIGACLAIFLYLKKKGHNATITAPNDYPDFLKWMPGTEEVINYESQRESCRNAIDKADIIFTLDFNDLSRIGDLQFALADFKGKYIMIDHHQQPSDYAWLQYSDVMMSSTCEMVWHFLDTLEETHAVDAAIASCLYAGIMTDTGSFRFPSTSSTTHRVVAELIDKGADNAAIHNAVFDSNSPDKLQLLGCALSNLETLPEYHTAIITLNSEELNRHNFKKGDTEGFVNYGLSMKGIRFAVILIESAQEQIIKISLRSKGDFSVNQFARDHFNGGGHINAAGGRSELSLEETKKKFKSLLPLYKDQLS